MTKPQEQANDILSPVGDKEKQDSRTLEASQNDAASYSKWLNMICRKSIGDISQLRRC